MQNSFENFMSDIGKKEDTRFADLQKAKLQQDGEDTPLTYDWLGEKVWSRDQLQDKGDKETDEQKRRKWEEQAREALRISQEHAHVEASTRVPWFPPEALMAWWVPDASEVPSTGAASVPEWASESPA